MRYYAWILLCVLCSVWLWGCSASADMIEITYPSEETIPEESTDTEETVVLPVESTEQEDPVSGDYVLNTSSHKFHYPSCSSVPTIKEKNRQDYTGARDTLLQQGFVPCKRCNP